MKMKLKATIVIASLIIFVTLIVNQEKIDLTRDKEIKDNVVKTLSNDEIKTLNVVVGTVNSKNVTLFASMETTWNDAASRCHEHHSEGACKVASNVETIAKEMVNYTDDARIAKIARYV